MSWILIAIIAYFLVALEVILDKFLLSSKRVSHPAIYAFYSGVLSLTTLLIFAPFGFHMMTLPNALMAFAAGIIFTYGILCLFFAINKSEASQAIPVVGAVIPLATYFLSVIFLQENLHNYQLLGIAVLIIGGLLISFDLPFKVNKKKFFAGFYYSISAGILLAIAFTAFKHFYNGDNFINVFIWTRVGLFMGALSLLSIPLWRQVILNSFGGMKKDKGEKKENIRTSILFILNKILGGTGSIMTNFAISLGSVTIVNALVSTEYAFVLLLGIIFSIWFPRVFQEKRDAKTIFEKIVAIALITIGIVLISMK